MRRLLYATVFLLSFLFGNLQTSSGDVSLYNDKNPRLIRRLYLDVLNQPPTIKELEWFLVYSVNGYETAVNEVLGRSTNLLIPSLKKVLQEFLLSTQYKTKESVPLSLEEMNFIIRYQTGVYNNDEEANKQLVQNAITSNQPGDMDPIDYMAENLMGRDTTAKEATQLNQILKRYPSEEEGYLEVLKELKTYKDFYTK